MTRPWAILLAALPGLLASAACRLRNDAYATPDAAMRPPAARDGGTRPDPSGDADAGTPADASGEGPAPEIDEPPPRPQCSLTASWSVPVQPTSLGDVGSGATVSASSLTAAWIAVSPTLVPALAVSDRADAVAPFPAPALSPWDAPATPLPLRPAASRVAMSGDGLRLVYVDETLTRFVELWRPSRAVPFGAPVVIDFTATGEAVGEGPRRVDDPVLTADGMAMIFSAYPEPMPTAPVDTLFVARRDASGWALVGALDNGNAALQSTATGERRLPTGMSEDGLTLFYDDVLEGTAKAAWRVRRTEPFTVLRDIPGPHGVQPTLACTKLFATASDGTGANALVQREVP